MKDLGVTVSHKFSDEVVVNGSTIHYEDAIVLPKAESEAFSKEELDAQKAQRVANFKNTLEHPLVQKEPTIEELQEQVKQFDQLLLSVQAQKAEVEAKVSALEKPVNPKETPVIEGEIVK